MARITRRHLTELDKRTLVALYREGATTDALVSRFGVSRQTVNRILKLFDISVKNGRPPKILDSAIQRIYREYSEGITPIDELAERYGISVSTLRRRVREYERSRKDSGMFE